MIFKTEKVNIGFDRDVLSYLDIYFKDAGNYESLKSFFESEYVTFLLKVLHHLVH